MGYTHSMNSARSLLVVVVFSWTAGCPASSLDADTSAEVTADAGGAEDTADGITADVTPERVDLAWPVGQDGPYQAGHRTVEFTYQAVSTGEERMLTLHFWYPTEATVGEETVYMGLLADEGCFEDAPLAAPAVGDRYPLHVHSHGHKGYAGSSPHLMRHFATHGWVVAAPDHRGNTIMDNIDPRPAWMYTVRLEDISATLDHLEGLDADDPLAGAVDPGRALLSGHSYGAYTALGLSGAEYDAEKVAEICAAEPSGACTAAVSDHFAAGYFEPRFVAAIVMAPGSYAVYGLGLAAIQTPTMHMTGSEDRPQDNADIWAALPESSVRVHVEGGCHQLFGLGGCDQISDDEGLPIVNGYALAFGRRHLLDDEGVSALLDGSERLSDAVTFSVK